MDLLRGYIQYLRDVSRKIVNRAGFENVLPIETRKKKNYYFNLDKYTDIDGLFRDDEYSIPASESEFRSYVKTVNSFLQSSDEHRWFFGLGIIHGKYENTSLLAPLVTVICNINNSENGDYQINVDEQSYQVNYDLLAKFLNIRIDEEADGERILTQEEENKFRAIEEIENEIFSSARGNKIPDIHEIFRKLKETITNFEEVQENTNGTFDYSSRLKSDPLFGKLQFTHHSFCFVRSVPNILSTYEALNDLLNQEKLTNKLLETLLTNSIKNQNEDLHLSDNIADEDVLKALNNIPFTLSKKQKEAIKKTWNNSITYIEGPPGTGKSYTIQAILHSALLLNKKVLFVSHKKPALKVVKNGVDRLLGKEAILFIATSDRNSGASDKKTTIKYLKDLLNESDELTELKISRRQNELDLLNLQLIDLNNKIEKITKDIAKDLQLTNEHFIWNKKFINKRDFFTKDLQIDLHEYTFKEKLYNELLFEKLFKKIKSIDDSETTNILNQIFRAKTWKYFISEFDAEKRHLQRDVNYCKDLFDLNYFYSRGNEKKNKIDAFRLDNNRKRLNKFEQEKNIILKDIFVKHFRFTILKKLYKNKSAKNSVQSYASALRRVSPKAILEYWEKVDFQLLTDIIPLWCAELRDLGIVFPMKSEIFDLIVVDEASQVNIAEIIPAFYRGKRFCIVGDDKQLHLNATGVGFTLSKSFDNLCWNKNQLQAFINVAEAKKRNLVVSDASILRFINSDLRAQRIPQTQLDEHYRSLPQLAKFSSDKFYHGNWKIMTENGKNRSLLCFKAINVNGNRDTKLKFVQAEIDELVRRLKLIIKNDGYLHHPDLIQFDFTREKPTIGILAILRNQVTKILEVLEESGISDSEFDEFEIMVGTPEEFQGNEKDIIFFTLGLDETGKWGKGHYEDEHRFNVATSRAKYFTYFIYGGIPRNANLIKKYLNHFGVKIREEDLIENENIPENSNTPNKNWQYNPSNFESEFEFKVAEYLTDFKNKNPEIEIFNQVYACGQKRLDFVLYNREKKITCAVEVDGIDHFIGETMSYTEAHLERIEILRRAKWQIINVKYHNWYSNGWLCDKNDSAFTDELNSLFNNLNELLQITLK
jgi:superfamily I DNA and/or RNA helicase